MCRTKKDRYKDEEKTHHKNAVPYRRTKYKYEDDENVEDRYLQTKTRR